jgi:hypothetical protein
MIKFNESIKHFMLIVGTLLISCFVVKGQNNSTEKTATKNSYGKFSISYLSDNVYNGRKDSLVQPYITPTLGYYDKSGFFISAGLSYLNSSTEKRVDLLSIDAGYDFSITDQFSGSVFANKSFYNGSSNVVSSEIKGSIGADLNYDLDFLNLFAGTELLFSAKNDITANFGISHDFEWGEKERKWSISPSILANFSTLNFYESYSSKKNNRKLPGFLPNVVSRSITTTVDNPGFTFLDYEISVPISYDTKKWGCFINSTLAIPKNPIFTTNTTITKFANGSEIINKSDSTPFSEKNLVSSFFVELGIHLKF